MSEPANPWIDPPHNHHATIAEAGDCPRCRAWTIHNLKDAPYAFLLRFPPDGDDPHALALIRDLSPDWSTAPDAAWATGCNLERGVIVEQIPVGVAVESGVEMFRLLEGARADDALRTIRGLLP